MSEIVHECSQCQRTGLAKVHESLGYTRHAGQILAD